MAAYSINLVLRRQIHAFDKNIVFETGDINFFDGFMGSISLSQRIYVGLKSINLQFISRFSEMMQLEKNSID